MCGPQFFRLCPKLVSTLLALGILSLGAAVHAGETRIAAAANFTQPAKEIGALFEKATRHRAVFSFGSTGQLYAQISQGAPFDVFLAADRTRAKQAVAMGFAVKYSRFTYATGRIVLFSRDAALVRGPESLKSADFNKLAIANPATAPYGAAAVAAMKALGVFDRLRDKMVRGNSIAQAYQLVSTGNAELGFVALSQVVHGDGGSRWVVPRKLHPPIRQDAVLLTRGRTSDAARAFIVFLKGAEARAVKEKYGYGAGE